MCVLTVISGVCLINGPTRAVPPPSLAPLHKSYMSRGFSSNYMASTDSVVLTAYQTDILTFFHKIKMKKEASFEFPKRERAVFAIL